MTKEEYISDFSDMISELDSTHRINYEALFRISESFVKPYVEKLCVRTQTLKELSLEDDVYQEVLLCLIKYSVDRFFYKSGELNDDPEGFLRWIYTVSKNVTINTARKQNYRYSRERSIYVDDGELPIADPTDRFSASESEEKLKDCFEAAVFSNTAVYIILVWLLRAIMLSGAYIGGKEYDESKNLDKSKISSFIADNYSDDLLSGIYAAIIIGSKRISWMNFAGNVNDVMTEKLSEDFDGIPIGEKALREFYMKKGGSASISDWIHKINNRILKTVEEKYKDQGGLT